MSLDGKQKHFRCNFRYSWGRPEQEVSLSRGRRCRVYHRGLYHKLRHFEKMRGSSLFPVVIEGRVVGMKTDLRRSPVTIYKEVFVDL